MDNYSLPPTRLDVVAQTMKTSQKVAAECEEIYAVVHYDLAVAKLAIQIQTEESPVYDNIFVCFGALPCEWPILQLLKHSWQILVDRRY